MRRMILIVDDEKPILFVLEHALTTRDDGWEVETASTGQGALRKAMERPFDLVISDMIMPDMDGIELAERIRDLACETTVIWMTAYGCQSFKDEAQRLGIYRCVEKPLEIQRFREVVRRAMATARKRDGKAPRPRSASGASVEPDPPRQT